MKMRSDFVTNSSSSSFLIIGVEENSIIDQLLSKEGIDEFCPSYGIHIGNVVDFYGSYGNDGPRYAGISIDELLERMNLSQLRQYFVGLIKVKYSIDISISDVHLYYGEVGD